MTDEEMKILELLAEAWNKFLELPTEHESDIREFQYGIHVLQRQVMARPTRREMNKAKLS
jgi:hypothetical protein